MMAGFYLRDRVRIYTVTKTPGTGEISSTSFESPAMVEEESKMIDDGNGRDVESKYYTFLPPGTAIKKGDKIQIIERFGTEVTEKERIVIQVPPYGSWSRSHIEVYS